MDGFILCCYELDDAKRQQWKKNESRACACVYHIRLFFSFRQNSILTSHTTCECVCEYNGLVVYIDAIHLENKWMNECFLLLALQFQFFIMRSSLSSHSFLRLFRLWQHKILFFFMARLFYFIFFC